jgi:transposase-like protein
MPEVRNVQTQQVDERCPVCGQGWMRSTGIVLTSNPPLYPHKCTSCNYQQTYSVQYPYMIYE